MSVILVATLIPTFAIFVILKVVLFNWASLNGIKATTNFFFYQIFFNLPIRIFLQSFLDLILLDFALAQRTYEKRSKARQLSDWDVQSTTV